MAHHGPIQQFTETCLACGQNIYDTDVCSRPKNCWTEAFSPTEDLPAATFIPDLKDMAIKRAIGPKWAFEITDKNAHVERGDLDAEAEIAAALAAEAALVDPPIGEYVFDPPYLLMRLRMLLTGTASPSDKVWAEALRKLLDHLETEEDR